MGFRVQGFGVSGLGMGFRVWGLRLRVFFGGHARAVPQSTLLPFAHEKLCQAGSEPPLGFRV